jgi:hypothetical protein
VTVVIEEALRQRRDLARQRLGSEYQGVVFSPGAFWVNESLGDFSPAGRNDRLRALKGTRGKVSYANITGYYRRGYSEIKQ